MSELIVTLHGLGQPKIALLPLQKWLEKQGYEAWNIGYPSAEKTLHELVDYLHDQLTSQNSNQFEKVHFIGNSMGGMLAHSYLMSQYRPSNFGRCVALGSPFKGSNVRDELDKLNILHLYFGAGWNEVSKKFRTENPLPTPDYDLGLITGTSYWLFPFTFWMNNGPNDGLVAEEDAKIMGITDHTNVPSNHNWLTNNPTARKQAIEFIKTGKFKV